MKKILSLFSALSLLTIVAGSALAQTTIAVNNGYWKGGDAFDVVVHENKGDKLKLYVNDKNPVAATVNKQGWATFHKVKLDGTGKLSFTQVFTGKNKKSVEKPFNYTRKFTVNGRDVTFTDFSAPAPAVTVQQPTPQPTPVDTSNTSDTANTGVSDTNLSNTNTYVNSDGTTVHSPAASTDGSVPAGATAQCKDGTYSFSQHRSGTCSGHGGVAQWL